MFIQHEKNVLLWSATLAVGVGILLGGGAARVKSQSCGKPQAVPGYCLESPRIQVAQGMVGGAFASGGALLMIELGKMAKR
ncbi:MAG: hypothetical protein DCF32_18765 [Leptolyngbya sp.]|nr:MAG: hypothetical protein DCF32_18765 [Leptolyngbya sp.]